MTLSDIHIEAEKKVNSQSSLIIERLLTRLSSEHKSEQKKNHIYAFDFCDCSYCLTLAKYSKLKQRNHMLKKRIGEYHSLMYPEDFTDRLENNLIDNFKQLAKYKESMIAE